MAVTLAGRRGHRNLQWFLRPGPHAQGLKERTGAVEFLQGMTADQTQKIQ